MNDIQLMAAEMKALRALDQNAGQDGWNRLLAELNTNVDARMREEEQGALMCDNDWDGLG